MSEEKRPVVVIPGYYASKLRDIVTQDLAWLNARGILQPRETLEALRLDVGNPDRLEAFAILDEFAILEPLLDPDIFKRLRTFLRRELDYPPELIHEIFYDWRRPLPREARLLHEQIEACRPGGTGKVDIIAHSHGGLVARTYMHRFGTDAVHRFITVGTPHKGMLKTFEAVAHGIRALLTFKRPLVRKISRTFPSAFELLPQDPDDGLFQWNGNRDNPLTNEAWCDAQGIVGGSNEIEAMKDHLAAAAGVVAAELPNVLPVKSCLIYGTRRTTTTLATGSPQRLRFEESDAGDSTVPMVSARGDGLTGAADLHRFAIPFGRHMLLYDDPAVQVILADLLLRDTVAPVHFVARFQREPFFMPHGKNCLVVVFQDALGNTPANADIRLTIEGTKIENQRVPSQPDRGDFKLDITRMPGPGKRLRYRVTAKAPSVPDQVHEGLLISTR